MRNKTKWKGAAVGACMVAASLALSGCAAAPEATQTATAAGTASAQPSGTATPTAAAAEYHKITAEEAKQILDTQPDAILVDVRELQEYQVMHIENAKLLPVGSIGSLAATELPDKNALILVYCRSGSRSRVAAQTLVSLGYTNVQDMGGIIDWPYGVVRE